MTGHDSLMKSPSAGEEKKSGTRKRCKKSGDMFDLFCVLLDLLFFLGGFVGFCLFCVLLDVSLCYESQPS